MGSEKPLVPGCGNEAQLHGPARPGGLRLALTRAVLHMV